MDLCKHHGMGSYMRSPLSIAVSVTVLAFGALVGLIGTKGYLDNYCITPAQTLPNKLLDGLSYRTAYMSSPWTVRCEFAPPAWTIDSFDPLPLLFVAAVGIVALFIATGVLRWGFRTRRPLPVSAPRD